MVVRTGPIRYAEASRFGPPKRVHDDVSSGQISPQLPSRLEHVMGAPRDKRPQGEDCLNLSITTPALDAGQRPVMVFLHGGGFMSGAGLFDWYDGSALSAEGDVVVVSVNYRLGALGYLFADGVSPGNLGLLDQAEALVWIRENISRFGGDPAQVTVFGQSAGAFSVRMLLGYPERLFHRAILQSDVFGVEPLSVNEAAAIGKGFLTYLPGDPDLASLDEILTAQQKIAADYKAATGADVPLPFRPISPSWEASDSHGVDVCYGWNAEEMSAFGGDHEPGVFMDPEYAFGDWIRRLGGRVFTYLNSWRPAGSSFGATHCVEIPLLLGSSHAWAGSPMLGATPWPEIDRLGREVRAAWTAFARTGVPGPMGAASVRWL